MAALRKKYKSEPNSRVPRMVYLDREPEFAQERQYLEGSISAFPADSQKKILGTLFSKNEPQHIGAWFELILFGWLRDAQIGGIIVEPEINGQTPDFMIDTGTHKIIVEARAFTKDDLTRKKEQWESEISLALQSIQLPYAVEYESVSLKAAIDASDFRDAVIRWLHTRPEDELVYKDGRGNQVKLSVLLETDLDHLTYMSGVESEWVNADPVKSRLKAKSGKYKQLVELGYSYVIALYLEPFLLSAEEVKDAWFGRTQYILDTEAKKVIDRRIDGSGMHFYGRQIQHRSVSGTLVFRRTNNLKSPFINGWYVENPYAHNPINNDLFPVESRFVVQGRDDRQYEMGWTKTGN